MRSIAIGVAVSAFALSALAQPASKPAIDNDQVTVWDVKLNKGQTGPATPKDLDTVTMFLEGGQVTNAGATVARDYGDVIWTPKGGDSRSTAQSDGVHEIVVALKDAPHTVFPNTTGFQLAFPRPGSIKKLENDRVRVWRHCWTQNVATPMHFHNTNVVVAYRYDGTLKSVTPDGTPTVNAYKTGDLRYNLGNRTHYELLLDPRQCAMMTELK